MNTLSQTSKSLREVLDAVEIGDWPGGASGHLEGRPVPGARARPGAAVDGHTHRVAVHGQGVRVADEVNVLRSQKE